MTSDPKTAKVEEPCSVCTTAYTCLESGVCRYPARSVLADLRAVTKKHGIQFPSVEEFQKDMRGDG